VIRRVQYELTMAASGAWREETLDQDYLARLLALQRAANPEGRAVLFAYDWTVDPYGRERPERTAMHTPNEYALRVAREHEEALACASVHPYRRDAVERLERAAEEGAVAVKWLPNAMGIDPASALCDAFYAKLAELGLPLLCHAGLELAVPGAEAELGNPLRLRRALEHGVRVVVAHCASAGSAYDLDAPGSRGRVSCFELFLRMMGEERWRGQLFGDVSALSVVNRCGAPLRRLIQAEGLHARLVNGSDYPLTAIDPAVSTRLLQLRGYLSGEDRAACEEVFDANPLLFDLVLKRSLAVAEGDGGGMRRFAAGVFESARVLG
jgi:mannonate dehydratase